MSTDKTAMYIRVLCFLSYIIMITAAATAIVARFANKSGRESETIAIIALMFAGIIGSYAYYISAAIFLNALSNWKADWKN